MGIPDTRQRLVLSAMELFWQKGYGSTSIADLLQKADVNSGSLYHFFPGKQDVLLAVLDMYHSGIRQMLLEPAWRGVSDPIGKVFALLARYRQGLVDSECFYACPIGSLALELHEPDAPVRERLAKNFTAWTEAIRECLDDAGPRLPAALDRRAAAQFVLTTMEGGVMLARTYRDIAYFDGAVEQLRLYFEHLGRDATAESQIARRKAHQKGKKRRTSISGPCSQRRYPRFFWAAPGTRQFSSVARGNGPPGSVTSS
jgi:TetR/AcrR family transcriptional repressor of nem operon